MKQTDTMSSANTPNRIQLYWASVKAFIQKEWPKITEVDLEDIDGEYDRLILKIKELYGGPDPITREAEVKGKLQRFLNHLEQFQ